MKLRYSIFIFVLLLFGNIQETYGGTQNNNGISLLQQAQNVYSKMRFYGSDLEISRTDSSGTQTEKLSLLFLQNPKSIRLKIISDDSGKFKGREYFYVSQPMRASWSKYWWSRPMRIINTRFFHVPGRPVIEHPYEKYPFLQRSYAIGETSAMFSGQLLTQLDIGWAISHFLEGTSSVPPMLGTLEVKNNHLCYKITKGDESIWIDENSMLPLEAKVAQPGNSFATLKWNNTTTNVRAVPEEFLGHRNYSERKKFLSWFLVAFIALTLIHYQVMDRRKRILLYIFSIIFTGFFFGAAVHPVGRMQDIYLGLLDGTYHFPRYLGIIMAVGIMTVLAGRIYCGYACPIGVIQELIYEVPVKKIIIISRNPFLLIRKFTFILMLFAGIVLAYPLFGFLNITGGRLSLMNLSVDFPYILTFAASAADIVLAMSIFVVALFIYRPFCRLFCPFGFIAACVSRISPIEYRKCDTCIECKRCNKLCPTGAVNMSDKGECYYCGRCLETCKNEGKALTNVNGITIRVAILCTVLMVLIMVFFTGYPDL